MNVVKKKKELPKSPPSISDYALTRRQFQILERALQKFKSDVTLWQQYLRIAQRAGARALAGRIAARAVQLHPRTPTLYVLAAAHELAHGGMTAARALLLRGLRLNAGCAELWREYVRLEMGFVEAMRRRWDVLGISLDDDDADDGSDRGERVDRAEEEAMGDTARRAIMGGAIVRQAIDSAAKGELSTFMLGEGGGRGIFIFFCDAAPRAAQPRPTLLISLGRSTRFYFTHIFFLFLKNNRDSVADDRAVSEPADAHCRISGTRSIPQLAAGSSAFAISRGVAS
jgi:hypothetical protein